jgi:serine/threonine protein kinase
VPSACPSCDSRLEKPDIKYCSRCGHDLSRPVGRDAFDGLIGQTIEGRYRVVERVGAGGMGVVYKVEHVRMGKIAAMKVLRRDLADDLQAAKRFRREVELVSRLDHPNIIQTFDFGEWHGLLYLVMEYIRGEDLSAIVKRDGPMPLERALPLFSQVCSALDEAHHHGIVHRDLKPDNIVCLLRRGQEEVVKVLDFGLATFSQQRGGMGEVTGAGSLIGTPYYMSPEQVRSEPTDGRSDIYSLGATLYRVVTGTPVFPADSPMAILNRHLSDDPQPPTLRVPELNLPIDVDHVILKALAKSPENRFATANEMKEAIDRIIVNVLGLEGPRRLSKVADPGAESTPPPASVDAPMPRLSPSTIAAIPSVLGGAQPAYSRTRSGFHSLKDVPSWVTSLPEVGESEPEPDTTPSELGARLRREDVDVFERGMRRRKRWVGIAGVAFALTFLASGWLFWKKMMVEEAETTEQEPNNSAASANLIGNGIAVFGQIGEPSPDGTPDFDYYRIPAGKAGRQVRAELSGVADLNVILELYDTTGSPVFKAERGRMGKGEGFGPIAIGKTEYFVCVRAVWVQGRKVESSDSPYALTVTW